MNVLVKQQKIDTGEVTAFTVDEVDTALFQLAEWYTKSLNRKGFKLVGIELL